MLTRLLFLGLLAAGTLPGSRVEGQAASAASTTAAVAAPRRSASGSAWYRRSRTIDLTGTNPRDSIVLSATGVHVDSLSISMTFYVNGTVAHRQQWTSDDELYDNDALRKSPAKLATFMRARLDEIVATVKRQPINTEQVQHMGDLALLKKIVPAPTHQIVLSFAFETSTFLAWDAARKKLVVFMECC